MYAVSELTSQLCTHTHICLVVSTCMHVRLHLNTCVLVQCKWNIGAWGLKPLQLWKHEWVIWAPKEKSCIHLIWQLPTFQYSQYFSLSHSLLLHTYVHMDNKHVTYCSIKVSQLIDLWLNWQAITLRTPTQLLAKICCHPICILALKFGVQLYHLIKPD